MTSDTRMIDEHVGELLSGYIDGELTQQDRQRVEVHCDACSMCSNERDELTALRRDMGKLNLRTIGEDTWRENMNDVTVRTSRGIGWLLFIGGILIAAGIGLVALVTEPSISTKEKLLIGAIYGGLALLFISVLRQRLIERKTDKYKDVEI
jgi:hypothetical protein